MNVDILLPHEVLSALSRFANPDVLHARDGLDPKSEAHLSRVESVAGDRFVSIGLWGDGVPCNWDRSETLEVFTLSLPGLAPPWANLRIPITGLSRKHVSARNTYDDILNVIRWSLTCCYRGEWPLRRHDGEPFGNGDHHRRKRAGDAIGARGLLVEIRGDWSFFKSRFSFPQWNQR